MRRTVLIAGGGTGGHLTPAIALIEASSQFDLQVILVTGDRPVEDRVLETVNVNRIRLKVIGFAGGSLLRKLWALCRAAMTCVAMWRKLGVIKPDLVILTGGYVALPVGLAATWRRLKLVLIEPNAIKGRTTRMLSKHATVVISLSKTLQWPAQCQVLHGMPVRRAILETQPKVADRHHLLVLGGSQGAAALNTSVPDVCPTDMAHVRHICGPNKLSDVANRYAKREISADVREYEHDMAQAYQSSTLVVARAGAATVAELLAVGLPTIAVPYPFAADNHQVANAQLLVEAQIGVIVEEGEAFEARLGDAFETITKREVGQTNQGYQFDAQQIWQEVLAA